MGTSPDSLDRWFPVVCLGVVWLGAAIFRIQAGRLRINEPEKADACMTIAYGLALWAPLTFAPLAMGAVLGQATVDDAFRPRSNPWALANMVGTLVVYARLTRWLYWQGGGEFLVEHSSLIDTYRRFESPATARLVVTLMMLGGVIAIVTSFLKHE